MSTTSRHLIVTLMRLIVDWWSRQAEQLSRARGAQHYSEQLDGTVPVMAYNISES